MPLGRRRKSTQIEDNSKITDKSSHLFDESKKLGSSIITHETDTSEFDHVDEDLCVNPATPSHDNQLPDTNAIADRDNMIKPDILEALPSTQTAVRSSTRVSKPPRRETYSPPHSPVKKQCKVAVVKESKCETPKAKRTWELWSADDKNIFFEGLAEYGKDFDSIQNLIAQKYKKKGTDPKMLKNKDQVRHFYYRTWHKIAEYAPTRDSAAVKKRVQELYGLINYGELRKKIRGTLNEKGGKKLTELIHTGVTTIKVRGKNIRIRTPVCKALKKINKIDDKDIKESLTTGGECHVPDKITVELSPRDNWSWTYVQAMAQNPRLRLALQPESKLSAVLVFLEKKWQPVNFRKRQSLQGSEENAPSVLRVFANRDSEVTPVSVASAKQQPPPQLHFDNFLTNILGIVRSHSVARNEHEMGPNSENSSGHDGAANSSPEPRQHPVKQLANASPTCIRPIGGSVDMVSAMEPLLCSNGLISVNDDNAQFPQDFSLKTRENCVLHDGTDCDENADEIKAERMYIDGGEPANESEKEENAGGPVLCSADAACDPEQVPEADTDEKTMNIDRESILKRFQTGWLRDECEDLSLAELYMMFGKTSSLRLQYQWCRVDAGGAKAGEIEKLSKPLSQLLAVATSQFTELMAKPRVSQEKMQQLCSKCSATLPTKSLTRKPTKPSTDTSVCRDAVFRVPTQPVKAVPFVQSASSVIPTPVEMRIPADASASHNIRPRAIRKQILVQRRLLPKAPQLMAYTIPSTQTTLVRLNTAHAPASCITHILPNASTQNTAPVTTSHVVADSSSLVTSETSSLVSVTTMPSLSTLSTESSQIFTSHTALNAASTPIPDRTQQTSSLDTTISPTNLSALLDISLPGQTQLSDSVSDRFLDIAFGNSNSSFSGLLENTVSESHQSVFKLGGDQQWLNGEAADISLGSLLAESPTKRSQEPETSTIPPVHLFSDSSRDFLAKHDVDSHIQSIMNESSVDLVSKFAGIAAQLANEQHGNT